MISESLELSAVETCWNEGRLEVLAHVRNNGKRAVFIVERPRMVRLGPEGVLDLRFWDRGRNRIH